MRSLAVFLIFLSFACYAGENSALSKELVYFGEGEQGKYHKISQGYFGNETSSALLGISDWYLDLKSSYDNDDVENAYDTNKTIYYQDGGRTRPLSTSSLRGPDFFTTGEIMKVKMFSPPPKENILINNQVIDIGFPDNFSITLTSDPRGFRYGDITADFHLLGTDPVTGVSCENAHKSYTYRETGLGIKCTKVIPAGDIGNDLYGDVEVVYGVGFHGVSYSQEYVMSVSSISVNFATYRKADDSIYSLENIFSKELLSSQQLEYIPQAGEDVFVFYPGKGASARSTTHLSVSYIMPEQTKDELFFLRVLAISYLPNDVDISDISDIKFVGDDSQRYDFLLNEKLVAMTTASIADYCIASKNLSNLSEVTIVKNDSHYLDSGYFETSTGRLEAMFIAFSGIGQDRVLFADIRNGSRKCLSAPHRALDWPYYSEIGRGGVYIINED